LSIQEPFLKECNRATGFEVEARQGLKIACIAPVDSGKERALTELVSRLGGARLQRCLQYNGDLNPWFRGIFTQATAPLGNRSRSVYHQRERG
jgi:hypothetical protein